MRPMTRDERVELEELVPALRDSEAQWHAQANVARSSSGGTSYETITMNNARGEVAAAMDRVARAQAAYRQAMERALRQ